MTKSNNLSECPGCHIILQATDYPADNRYGIASASCRKLFDEIIVKEGELYGYPPAHRLIVDAYGVQHPPRLNVQTELGISKRLVDASVQSVAIHLIALYAALEKNVPLLEISDIMRRVLSHMNPKKLSFPELLPPENLGKVRVDDVHKEVMKNLTLDEYTKLALSWAQCAWDAWSQEHNQIRYWYNEYLK